MANEREQKVVLLPCRPAEITPRGSVRVPGDEIIYQMTDGGRIRMPATTPVMASPASSSTSTKRRRSVAPSGVDSPKKCRRSLNLTEETINDSDGDNDGSSDDEDDPSFNLELSLSRHNARELRDLIVEEEEEMVSQVSERPGPSGRVEGSFAAAAPAVEGDFVWSDDVTSFSGQKETYLRVPGPTFSYLDPVSIFLKIWDQEFVEMVAKQTNENAWLIIGNFSNPDKGKGIPRYLDSWTDVTVDELYRYFAIIISMSFCHRSKVTDYWTTGFIGMPAFRKLMSRNRFIQINKFLHFVDNGNLSRGGYAGKIEKIAPILDHCNKRFAELYTPSQHLSLDESLLLWKGRLSWKQCNRSKAARFGIKSYELCEAGTGYLLQIRLYAGKGSDMHSDPVHGFQSHSAKIVLDLMDGYLDVGHVLVMDNWYNQLPLTRYLKSRRTDVLGTLNRRRVGVPPAIKDLEPNRVKRGDCVTRHSGDIALTAWKDVKLVTVMSTYSQHKMIPGKRAGKDILKPEVVQEYNTYMGGVDLKDQKLSMFLIERKRIHMWYIKVFRRLLNTSLLNAYIIHTRTPLCKSYSHRQFRLDVVKGLFCRFPASSKPSSRVLNTSQELPLRLQPGQHFPIKTETTTSGKLKQLRCVRCYASKKRVNVTIICGFCKAPLCVGKCWRDHHTVINL